MGVYYRWICPAKRQYLDVDRPLHETIKSPEHAPNTLRALALLCRWGSWARKPVYLACDAADYQYWEEATDDDPNAFPDTGEPWKSATPEAMELLAEHFPETRPHDQYNWDIPNWKCSCPVCK